MRFPTPIPGRRALANLATVLLTAGLLAACSTDSARFSQAPTPPRAIASAGPATDYTAAVPAARIDRQPLAGSPAIASAPLPSASAPRPAQPAYGQPKPYSQPSPAYGQASPGAAQPRPAQAAIDWRAPGASRVPVMPGDNVEMLARRYGVSEASIRSANAMPVGQPVSGQMLVIPAAQGRKLAAAPAAPRKAQAAAPARAAARSAKGVHVVAPGETLISVARLYEVPVRDLAAANTIPRTTRIRIGQRLSVPGVTPAQMAKLSSRKSAGAARAAAPRAPEPAPEIQLSSTAPEPAAAEPETPLQEPETSAIAPDAATASVEEPGLQPAAYAPPASAPRAPEPEPAKPEPARLSSSSFRWPVRGRIIAEFGETSNGQRNDGINFAVPEGAPVKAAENGVVVYSGSELKGYGNLVLVRHEGDFVTAYAHNSELQVKRGDTVRRGQIIA